MAYGAHGLPGDRFTGGQGYRLAQLLARQNVNNGTNAGGLAHVGNQLMQALLMKRDMEAVEKDKADQAAVGPAMQKGMNAKPWVNPDTGSATIPEYQPPGTMGPPKLVPTADAGGMPGAMASLAELGDNPYAGKLTQQLLVAKAQSEDQLKNAQALKASPGYEPSPDLVRQYRFAQSKEGGNFPGSYQDFVAQVSATKQGPTAPMQNFSAYNDIVKQFGENSPQANLFRQFVRANQWQDRGDAKVLPDAANPTQNLAVIPKGVPPEQTPEIKGKQAKEGAIGKAEGEAVGDAGKKAAQGKTTLDLLSGVESLIDKSTGSLVGAGADAAAGALGYSTEGAQAAAQLKVLQSTLMLNMPRMEGPQSDRDVNLYRENAGMIGDPTVPAATKKAALQIIREISKKYETRAPARRATDVPEPGYNRRAGDTPQEFDYVPGQGLVPRAK